MVWSRIHKNILSFLKVVIIWCRASKHQIFWTHQYSYDYKGNPMLLYKLERNFSFIVG